MTSLTKILIESLEANTLSEERKTLEKMYETKVVASLGLKIAYKCRYEFEAYYLFPSRVFLDSASIMIRLKAHNIKSLSYIVNDR